MRNISDRNCSENRKNTFYVKYFLFLENHNVYEIMWKNNGRVRQAEDGNTIGRMRFACWTIKTKGTLSENI